MKIAINAWSVEESVGFADMFCQIKEAGFDGIELNIDKEGQSAHSLTMATTQNELEDIKQLSERYSLPVVSISTSLYGGLMGSPNREDSLFAQEVLKKQLLCAKALGASGILTVPGGISRDVSIKQAYHNSFETMYACKDVIDSYKIFVGVENVWNTFFLSPFDMSSFIESIGSDYVSAYFDVGNVMAFSWPEYWIEVLGKHLKHVHFKDYKRNNNAVNRGGTFVSLTKGSVRWDKVTEALRASGFDGYVTAEVEKESEQSYQEFYIELSNTMREIIKTA